MHNRQRNFLMVWQSRLKKIDYQYNKLGRGKDVITFPSLFFIFCAKIEKNIMGKVSKVRANVTAKRKPKLSSGKGGFLVAKVAAINKNKQKRNG